MSKSIPRPEDLLNRELSWVAFNERVLEEAEDPSNPLLERVKFLSIVSSNFDEFFMVRVAGIWRQIDAGITIPGPDGLTPRQVLEQVAALPVQRWAFKQDSSTRHIGPMAQDFHAAFPLNRSETSLNDADLHGVALAAIQGLNQKVQQKETEITELKRRLEALERRLSK